MDKLAYQFVGIFVKLPIRNRWHPHMGTSEEFNERTIYKAVKIFRDANKEYNNTQQQSLPTVDLTLQGEEF